MLYINSYNIVDETLKQNYIVINEDKRTRVKNFCSKIDKLMQNDNFKCGGFGTEIDDTKLIFKLKCELPSVINSLDGKNFYEILEASSAILASNKDKDDEFNVDIQLFYDLWLNEFEKYIEIRFEILKNSLINLKCK